MPNVAKPTHDNPVRLAEKVRAIIDALPPEIASMVRRDTERVQREARRVRAGAPNHRPRRDRRGAWSRRAVLR